MDLLDPSSPLLNQPAAVSATIGEEITARIAEGLSFDLTYGYLKAIYKDYDNTPTYRLNVKPRDLAPLLDFGYPEYAFRGLGRERKFQ